MSVPVAPDSFKGTYTAAEVAAAIAAGIHDAGGSAMQLPRCCRALAGLPRSASRHQLQTT